MLKLTPTSRLNLLVAYPYMNGSMVESIRRLREVAPVRLMLDSGAYSAWNSGHAIDLDDYCEFLSAPPVPYDYAVQLDVFGNAEASYDNLMTMRGQGFTDVLPVFTRGETLERLEEFYRMAPYIMFGGVTTGESNRAYINWFLANNRGRACHWLGFVDLDFIKHYRPASVDSSSWHFQARTGNINVYKGHGKLQVIHQTEMPKLLAQPGTVTSNYIDGVELLALRDNRSWRSGKGAMSLNITARAHLLRMLDVERMLGTKIYLACSADFQVDALTYAWKTIKANT